MCSSTAASTIGGLRGLPSGRAVTHTGGGLAANSTANNHTGTVTLTAGGVSYVLTRTVFDRAEPDDRNRRRTTARSRATPMTAPTDRWRSPIRWATSRTNTFDANGNVDRRHPRRSLHHPRRRYHRDLRLGHVLRLPEPR